MDFGVVAAIMTLRTVAASNRPKTLLHEFWTDVAWILPLLQRL
jgi:hypothetical protein